MVRTKPKNRTDGIDMLHGTLWDKILRFAIPLALTGILQQLFNAADIAVIGQFVGGNAMAAVGANGPIVGLSTSLFIGISMGANVVISIAIGKNHEREISGAVHTALLTAVISGFLVMLIGETAAPAVLRAMSVPPEVLDMAVLYLRVYMAGMPVILLYNFESAIFRSQGDTRTPLIALTFSGVLNVGLNLLFVLVLHMTVEGVALATVLSNGVSAAILLRALARKEGPLQFRFSRLKIDRKLLGSMLRIGLPAGLQGAVFSLSNLLIQSAINSLGPAVMAGSSAAFNVEIIAYFILNSFGQAATSFVGQNHGAGQDERCRRVTRVCVLMGAAGAIGFALIAIPLARPILTLFNGDEAILQAGILRVKYIVALEAVNCFMDVISGSMRGYEHSLAPALITLLGVCGSRVIWVYWVFPLKRTFERLLLIYPVSWIITAACLCVAYLLLMRKLTAARTIRA